MSDQSPPFEDSSQLHWRAAAADLDWASWGGEQVLFHRPSGYTHFVNAATVQLLQMVLVAPRTLDEVTAALAAGLAPEEVAALREHIDELLQRLEELGVVSVSWQP